MNFYIALEQGQLLAKLSRPQNIVYSGLLCSLTAFLLKASILKSITSYFTILILYAIAASYNNLSDIKTDKLNSRFDNPLISNKISKNTLKTFFSFCFIALLMTQLLLLQPSSIYICLIYLVLAILYSHPTIKLKSRSWFAIFVLSICYGCLPFLLGLAQTKTLYSFKICEFLIFQILLLFPVLLAKDYKDIKGDRLTNKLTPLIVYGQNIVIKVARLSLFVASFLYLYLSIKNKLNIPLSILMILIYISLGYKLHKNKGQLNKILRDILTIDMLLLSLELLNVLS